MGIVQKFTTANPCYTSSRSIKPQGMMLHSVGCPQPDPNVFWEQWNDASAQVGVHYVVGADVCYQCLPDTKRAWHAGSPANDMYISCEMTEPATIKYTGGSSFKDNNPTASKAHVLATYNNAVELFAQRCKEYGFDPMTQILSHAEGYKRGVATNHGDPDHLFRVYGLSMDGFRRDVKARMGGSSSGSQSITPSAPTNTSVKYRVRKSWSDAKSQVGAYNNLDNAKRECDKHSGYSVYDVNGKDIYGSQATSSNSSQPTNYLVKVTVSALNIRPTPSTSQKEVGVIRDKGVYTIVEESNGWGKLKSGKGWIYLEHTQRL